MLIFLQTIRHFVQRFVSFEVLSRCVLIPFSNEFEEVAVSGMLAACKCLTQVVNLR